MTHTEPAALPAVGWRLKTGIALFVLGLICPVFIPLIVASGLPAQWKAIFSGAMALGIPEVLWIAAAAVMGKAGFALLKQRVFGFLKPLAPPEKVSRGRYRIGLMLMLGSLLLAWVSPYAAALVHELTDYRIALAIGGDVLLLISLLVLGGEFWDKLRALFVHGARVEFPADGPR